MQTDPSALSDVPKFLLPAARDASDLVDGDKSQFAGVWYDPKTEAVILDVSDPEAISRARAVGEKSGFDVRQVKRSRDTISESYLVLGDQEALLGRAESTDYDPAINGWRIHLITDDVNIEEVERAAQALDLPVSFDRSKADSLPNALESRGSDPSPFAGGMKYGGQLPGGPYASAAFYCTTAFGVIPGDYAISAGHCLEDDSPYSEIYRLNSSFQSFALVEHIGHWTGRTTLDSTFDTRHTSTSLGDGGLHGDLSEWHADSDKEVGSKVWVGGYNTTSKIDLTSRSAPAVNDFVCFGGATSGSHCTFSVTATNTSFSECVELPCNTDATVADIVNGDRAVTYDVSDCAQPGDSGGSVYQVKSDGTIRAIGSLSGGSGIITPPNGDPRYCVIYFTGIEEAIQAWGGNLDFS